MLCKTCPFIIYLNCQFILTYQIVWSKEKHVLICRRIHSKKDGIHKIQFSFERSLESPVGSYAIAQQSRTNLRMLSSQEWRKFRPPTERKSSRDVYCLGTARNDCIADAPIQQIFQEQTCGVSDYTHRHDNAPTLGKEVSVSMAANLEDEARDGTGRTW